MLPELQQKTQMEIYAAQAKNELEIQKNKC